MEFKIGDWYYNKHFNSLHQLTQTIVGHPRHDNTVRWVVIGQWQVDITTARTKFEPWQPKEGEWCWFFGGVNGIPTVLRFVKQKDSMYYAARGNKQGFMTFTYCEPFSGELPTFLKDK